MIATLVLSLLFVVTGGAEPSTHADFQLHNREARAARERNDYAAYLRHVREVWSLVPGNASVRFALARAYALNGHDGAALAELETLARQGFGYGVIEDPAFARMAGVEAFHRAAAELLANAVGEAAARLGAVTLPDEMRGEAVAWSPSTNHFLLGGVGGIYRVGPDGNSSMHLLANWDAGVLGIRPDPATGTFLACVNQQDAGTALVARHRLSDGALLATHVLPAAGALCNDIAIFPDGGFAVTDSSNSLVFRLERGRLTDLRLGRTIFLPNGIAMDPAAGRLFVADANGVLVHDLATAESWHLEPESTSIAAIDGMIWHDGALIGVQNQTIPARLLRIRPDAAARRATVDVLLSDPALANSATVAAIDDTAFVYVRPADEGHDGQPRLVRVRL